MNDRRKQRVLAISTIVGLAFLAACNNPPPSDQHLQEQAAQATENAKQAFERGSCPGPGGCGQRRADSE